jgi:hypothetical protein
MNDSQKARALADVIDRKYECYTRVIAEQLDHKVFTERVNAAGMHNTFDWPDRMSSTTLPPVRRFGDDLTLRWSCRVGEFVLWVGLQNFLASDRECGWTIRDFWLMRDGDFVTITNRSADLPPWFELHPSEVCGSAVYKMMERLAAGYQPKEPMDAPTIWRVNA